MNLRSSIASVLISDDFSRASLLGAMVQSF
jgi:hypothetical protein